MTVTPIGRRLLIPEEFIAFDGETVDGILVDGEGGPYDADKREAAHIYRNDTERVFLFYQSNPYTKDPSLIDGNIFN